MTLVERLRRLSEDAQIQRALKDGKTIAQIVAECGVTVAPAHTYYVPVAPRCSTCGY